MFGIAWCVYLYNFMDGIDGLAVGQGSSSAVPGILLLAVSGPPGLALVSLM